MFAIRVLIVSCICSLAFSQISQKEACQKLPSAVVEIDAGGSSHGTGFIVSADGWVLTAAHVILDETSNPLKAHSVISVTLPDGSVRLAEFVSPIEPNTVARDYALLKIAGKNLTHLDIGDKPDEVVIGSELTIIGFPFSAVAFHGNGPGIKDKFCLSATVAYSGEADVPISANTAKGTSTVNVKVDVIYFQGPSVKGLSGSPIISRDTGHVIGILTSKLTGINPSLANARAGLANTGGAGVYVNGVHDETTIVSLVDILDQQLANGLGAGTGIEDVKAALRHAQRQRKSSK